MQPGHRGIDYSGARPSPADIVKADGKFIVRYSAGVGNTSGSTQWKLCGVHEIGSATSVGLDFIANSEWYETRITEGASAGAADGFADLAFWRSRGLNAGSSIYVSWDADPLPSKWPAAISYLKAYDHSLGGYYHVDCYGGTAFLAYALKLGVIRHGWRTNAGAWSNDGLPYQPNPPDWQAALAHTPAHIWQTGNYWFNNGADENIILRLPVGSHLEAIAQPTPTSVGDIEIVDVATKTYFDAQFAKIAATMGFIVHGDATHPHSQDRIFTWLDSRFSDADAKVSELWRELLGALARSAAAQAATGAEVSAMHSETAPVDVDELATSLASKLPPVQVAALAVALSALLPTTATAELTFKQSPTTP